VRASRRLAPSIRRFTQSSVISSTLACREAPLLGCESELTSELTAPEPSLSAAGHQSVTGHVNIPPQDLFGINEHYSFNGAGNVQVNP
jgi:hypothetical protein